MSKIPAEKLPELQARLAKALKDNAWRKVLHALAIVGAARHQQLVRITGLQRDKLTRTLAKMDAAAAGLPPLYGQYQFKIKRFGERGTAPKVYRLLETGAELCRADGLAHARACNLEDSRAIQHALGILDVHIAAQEAGLAVVTDRNLPYNETAFIRPDNLVTLPDGEKLIFESEQNARSDYLDRIRRSLDHKAAFFNSAAAHPVAPTVRMLVDLPRGKHWQHTLHIWRQAVEIVTEAHRGSLPFKLAALPLDEFMNQPDWGAEPDPYRWVDLTQPLAPEEALSPEPLSQAIESVPQYAGLERRMILAALWQHLQAEGKAELAPHPRPDVECFYLLRLIYLASHDPFYPASQRSGIPYESLYLLKQYLDMQPRLRTRVIETTQMDARRIHWNQSTALHRMQLVADAFMAYHGWSTDGPLVVYACTPDYLARSPRRFTLIAEIRDREILMAPEADIVPGTGEIEILEKSLSWALSALFTYHQFLGLPKAPFW